MAIVFIAIGSAILLLAVVGVLYYLVRLNKRKSRQSPAHEGNEPKSVVSHCNVALDDYGDRSIVSKVRTLHFHRCLLFHVIHINDLERMGNGLDAILNQF